MRAHRRRPGPQPRHGRRLDRPLRPGLGPAGDGSRARLLGRAALAARRADRPARRLLRGPVPDRRWRPTSCSSRSSGDPCRPAPRVAYRKLAQPASGYSIVGRGRGRRDGRRDGQPRPGRADRGGRRTRTARRPSRRRSWAATDRRRRSRRLPAHATDGQTVNGDIHADREYRLGHGRRLHPSRDRGRARALARDERQPAIGVQVHRVTPGRRAPARLAGADPRARPDGSAPPAGPRAVGCARTTSPRSPAPSPASRSASSSSSRASSTRTMRRSGWRPRSPARPRSSAARPRAGSTSLAEAAGVAQRPDRRPRAPQPDRPARGLHRLRRPGRGARRPRRERQGRPARRRRRAGRRGRAGGRLRQPPARVGRAVHPVAGSGSSSRSRSGRRARERFEASVRAKVEGLGSTIESIEYVEDDPEAVEAAMAGFVRRPDPARAHPDRRRGQHRPARCRASSRSTALGGRIVRRGVPGAPGLDAVAGAHRRDGDPRPADLRRLLEGDRRGPAAAAAAVRRGDRPRRPSPSSATAGSSPAASASASRPTPASSTRPTGSRASAAPRGRRRTSSRARSGPRPCRFRR